jgi:hypothetical protein
MSAAEVIEQIKKLSPEERRTVRAFLQEAMQGVQDDAPKVAHVLHDTSVAAPQPKYIDQETFERVAKWAVDEHRELLSRLAK